MFLRKNITHTTSLFAKEQKTPKVYDIFSLDNNEIKYDDIAHFYIFNLSSGHLAVITKHKLIILDSFNLKEVSSIPFDVVDETCINIIETPNNQLQIFLTNSTNNKIKM